MAGRPPEREPSGRDPIPVRAAAAPAVGSVTKADPCASLDPSTLEAYRDLIGYLRSILEMLPEAAHWATISAVYHKSQRARDAFEETIAAIGRGNELMGEAGRCFMTGYF